MGKSTRRILSFVLALAMMLTQLPALTVMGSEADSGDGSVVDSAVMTTLGLLAADYHADDLALMNAFAAENSELGWPQAADTLTESWMNQNWPGVYWSARDSKMRVTSISLESKGLTGTVDLSGLTALGHANLGYNYLTGITASDNPALYRLDCHGNGHRDAARPRPHRDGGRRHPGIPHAGKSVWRFPHHGR